MRNPAPGNLNESYVELYNPTTGTMDLSGWQFTKGFQHVFPANTTLALAARRNLQKNNAGF